MTGEGVLDFHYVLVESNSVRLGTDIMYSLINVAVGLVMSIISLRLLIRIDASNLMAFCILSGFSFYFFVGFVMMAMTDSLSTHNLLLGLGQVGAIILAVSMYRRMKTFLFSWCDIPLPSVEKSA